MAATKVVPLIARPLLKEHTRRNVVGMLRGRLSSLVGDIKCIATSSALALGMPQPEYQMDIKTNRWHRVIAEADKLLAHPTMTIPGQMLPVGDVADMAKKLESVLDPEHPLRKIFQRLQLGQTNMQAKGLIILLLAKVFGQMDLPTQGTAKDKFNRQHGLASGADLAHMAMQAHVSITNTSCLDRENIIRGRLDYVNKISILIGDLMLCKANGHFGSIRNAKAAHLMATAIRENVTGRLMYDADDQGKAYPTKTTTMADWETRSCLVNSSILANSFKSLAIIEGLDDSHQNSSYQLGKQIGLAWQASAELESFLDASESSPTAQFSLVSCPVVLYLQRDQSILDLLAPFLNDLTQVDYKKIHEMVSDSPAVREAQDVCQNHVQSALNVLQHFPNCEARIALENIITALEV